MQNGPQHRFTERDSIDMAGAVATTVQVKCACCLSHRVHRSGATVHEHEDVHVELECEDCPNKSLVRVFGDGNGQTFVQVMPAKPIDMMRRN